MSLESETLRSLLEGDARLLKTVVAPDVAKLEDIARTLDKGGIEDIQFVTLKSEVLGKSGVVKEAFQKLRDLSGEDKVKEASILNNLREAFEKAFEAQQMAVTQKKTLEKISSQFIDPTLPGKSAGIGALHPVTRFDRMFMKLLRPFGFQCAFGPEIEDEYFCFDALNIPAHHPARDMQDTFYTSTNQVMRTHTSSVQTRSMVSGKVPLKVACYGKTYRNETEDASHQAMFHQFDIIWLEPGLTLSHLMGLVTHLLKGIYGKKRKVRFVPKFYPYTEPSIGAQIECSLCRGEGCPACGHAGWVTVGGAGMIHRNVISEFKYDPDKVSGFAFGLGSSRLASQLTDVPKLKMLYDNDIRVLRAAK